MVFSNFSTRSFNPFLPVSLALINLTWLDKKYVMTHMGKGRDVHYFANPSDLFKTRFNFLILLNQQLHRLITMLSLRHRP